MRNVVKEILNEGSRPGGYTLLIYHRKLEKLYDYIVQIKRELKKLGKEKDAGVAQKALSDMMVYTIGGTVTNKGQEDLTAKDLKDFEKHAKILYDVLMKLGKDQDVVNHLKGTLRFNDTFLLDMAKVVDKELVHHDMDVSKRL